MAEDTPTNSRTRLAAFLSDGRWARLSIALLGVWLFLSSYIGSRSGLAQVNVQVVAAALLATSLLALRWPALRWGSLAVTAWLMLTSYALGSRPVIVLHNAAVAFLVIVLSLLPNARLGRGHAVATLPSEGVPSGFARSERRWQTRRRVSMEELQQARRDPELAWRVGVVSRICTSLMVVIGLLVAIGWLGGSTLLTHWHPALSPMKPTTAVSVVLTGVGIRLLGRPTRLRRTAAAVASLVVVATALFSLAGYARGWIAGVDEVLLLQRAVSQRTRTSPVTAVVLVMLATALLILAGSLRDRRLPHWLAFGAGLVTVVTLIAYAYGVRSLNGLFPLSWMSLPSAVALALCSLSILCLEPTSGWAQPLVSRGPDGVLLRTVIPGALILPIALGWLRLKGEEAGLYGTSFGEALYTTSTIVGLGALILLTARALAKTDLARREIELQLRDSEEDLASTVDSIGDAVIATDAEARITRMNPVAERLTGVHFEDVRERPLDAAVHLVHPDSGQPIDDPIKRVILRGGTVVGQAKQSVLIAHDGRRHFIVDSGSPIRDSQGTLRGVVLVLRDQTREREAERAIEASEARKRAIFEDAPDPIAGVDQDGKIIEFNPAAEQVFALSKGSAAGKPLLQLFTPESLDTPPLKQLRRAFENGEDGVFGKRIDAEGLRADGTRFPAEVSVARSGADGAPMFTAYIRDLSDRVRTPSHRDEATH